MGFDNIFRNRIMRPVIRPVPTKNETPTEKTIVWSADASGLLARIEALEAKVDQLSQLSSALSAREVCTFVGLGPDPIVSMVTGCEYAPDGTLRAYVEVTVENYVACEVALLGTPTITYATKDATVDEASPDSSFGEDPFIEVLAGDAPKRAWLQFDWGNYPGDLWAVEPVLAVLHLAKSSPSSGEAILYLGYEDLSGDDWDEATICWNNQPNIGSVISYVPDNAESDYTLIELTGLFHMFYGIRQNNPDFVPYGLVVLAQGSGSVQWKSREGAVNDGEKPQIWYWEEVEESRLVGSFIQSVKLYGTPGGTYYLVYRRINENNSPGRWSVPVEVQLPSA